MVVLVEGAVFDERGTPVSPKDALVLQEIRSRPQPCTILLSRSHLADTSQLQWGQASAGLQDRFQAKREVVQNAQLQS